MLFHKIDNGWLTINLDVVQAYGLDNGDRCDQAVGSQCEVYAIISLNGNEEFRTSVKESKTIHNFDQAFIFDYPIPKSSKITIELWEDDAIQDDLILRTSGDINSFLQHPFRTCTLVNSYDSFVKGQNSINTYSFWQNKY